jgi:arginase
MAVAVLTGHGDPEVLALLPATIGPDRVALVGLHDWTDDDFPNVANWGITSFGPDDLRESSRPLLEWLADTGCSRVAVHLDVDVVDSNDMLLGLGAVPDGFISNQVRRVISDIDSASDVVGLTIAEYVPRQVMQLRQLLEGFPLL